MENEALAADLLDGVAAISEFTGWPIRRAYHEAERGRLPLFKLHGGRKWQGRKSTLRQHIAMLEAKHGEPEVREFCATTPSA